MIKIIIIVLLVLGALTATGVLVPGLFDGIVSLLWGIIDILIVVAFLLGLLWLIRKLLEQSGKI